MGTKAMKFVVATFAALALAGCAPGFEKTASAPRPEPRDGAPSGDWAEEPGGEIRRLAGRAGRRRDAPHRHHRPSPGNEIEVTPAQLRAEILAIDRMLEKEGRAR